MGRGTATVKVAIVIIASFEEVLILCDKESPPLWIQTPRPLKKVDFGLVGMLESDTRHHTIAFCSQDKEETTGAK